MIKKLWKLYFPKYGIKYWYMNAIRFPKQFPRFLKDLRHFMKYGYPCSANWDIPVWFVETMKSLLQDFLENNNGYPDYLFNSFEEWQETIKEMICLLDTMDADLAYDQDHGEILKNKDQFFELFVKYFYNLWW